MNNAETDVEMEVAKTINELPNEILLNIFKYLNYGDLQVASLTCRHWLHITNYSGFRKNTRLIFANTELHHAKYPVKLFENTKRFFPNVHIVRCSLNNYGRLFNGLRYVRSLHMRHIDLNSTQLFSLINQLKHLEVLHISGCRGIFEDKLFKRNCNTHRTVARVLLNLRELRLDICEDDNLTNIWQLSKLVTNLKILVFTIWNDNVNETQKLLPGIVRKNSRTIKELGIMNVYENYSILRKCGRAKNMNLKKLECWYGTAEYDILSLLAQQQNLVEFKYVNGFHKLRISIDHIVNVEVLNFAGMRLLSRENLMVACNLKKLRSLDISRCQSLTSDDICATIGRTRNENMRVLRIGNLAITDKCMIALSENLPNLERLDVTSSTCFNKPTITDIGAQAIFKNLVKLKELTINGNVMLTDFGITGRTRTNSVRKCKKTPPNGFSIRRLKGLKRLQLAGCVKLTNVSINEMKFLELSVLKMDGNKNITRQCVQKLCVRCPSIQVLEFTGSPIRQDAMEVFLWLSKNIYRLKALTISVACSYSEKCFHDLHARRHSGVLWRKVIHCNCKSLARFRKPWNQFTAFK